MKSVVQLVKSLFVVLLGMLPLGLLAQNPGDNPDARPQDVPFDSTMSWMLVAAGLILAVVVIRKALNKRIAVK